MPNAEITLPVGATNIKVAGSTTSATLTRTGKDGDEVIVPVFTSEYFSGEFLEGIWSKDDDSNILAGGKQGLIARIASSPANHLELTAASDAGGTARGGWIKSNSKIYFGEDDVSLIVELETASSVTASRNVEINLVLVATDPSGDPTSENDFLRILLRNLDGTYGYYLQKNVNGTATDVTGDGWVTVTNPNVKFKLTFQETDDEHTHFYVDDGETGTWTEYTGTNDSPFDLSLNFTNGYISYKMGTNDATERSCYSDYITVDYPDFETGDYAVRYDLADANVNKGNVDVFDGDPDGTGVQVCDSDHSFANDCYIQNGLLRLHVDDGVQYGLKIYAWIGSSWTLICDRIRAYFNTSAKYLDYPFLKNVESISPEKAIVNMRVCDSATEDADFYIDVQITLERGKYYFEYFIETEYPSGQTIEWIMTSSTKYRFGYAGDSKIGDDNLDTTGGNATFSDNFVLYLDDAGTAVLVGFAVSHQPTTRFRALDGGTLVYMNVQAADIGSIKFFIFAIPFSFIANLFKEAEDATSTGTNTDLADDSGTTERLDAQNEYVQWDITAGTDLPKGKYLALVRAKDNNQVADDLETSVYNTTDSKYRNEENADVHQTVTSSWAYYQIIFEITDADVSDTDTIRIKAKKDTTSTNNLDIDYFLAVPLFSPSGNFPGDLAHNALRTYTKTPKVYAR